MKNERNARDSSRFFLVVVMLEPVVAFRDGTFLSVATEKYPKDRDLRKNQGFPLKIPFLFMNTDYMGLMILSVAALPFGRAGRCAPSESVSAEILRVRSRPMPSLRSVSGRGMRKMQNEE